MIIREYRETDWPAVWASVVETNVAAVKLWQALGFEIIGTVPEAFEHLRLGRVGLHIMHRRL